MSRYIYYILMLTLGLCSGVVNSISSFLKSLHTDLQSAWINYITPTVCKISNFHDYLTVVSVYFLNNSSFYGWDGIPVLFWSAFPFLPNLLNNVCILDFNPLLDEELADIFHSLSCFFTLVIYSSVVNALFNLM
jgi:hypothetical protein